MIIIADLHFGKTSDSFLVTPEDFTFPIDVQTANLFFRLKSILSRAVMTHQNIVVAGDIFNRMNPTTLILSIFFKWLSLCDREGVSVYLIAGNHDAGATWSNAMMFQEMYLPNVTVVSGASYVTLKEGNICRDALLWSHLSLSVQDLYEQGHGSVTQAIADRYPGAEFIITHGQIVDQLYSNDIFFEAGNAMVIDPKYFKKLKLMVLGHQHSHSFGKNWVYPGSVTINNFGEVDEEKGWVEVDLKTLVYQWFPWPEDDKTTPWIHLELDLTDKDEASIDEEKVESFLKGAIIKVTVLAKRHGVIHEANIRAMLNKYGYVSRFETKIIGEDSTVETVKNVYSPEDLLKSWLSDAKATKAVKALAMSEGKKIIQGVLSK